MIRWCRWQVTQSLSQKLLVRSSSGLIVSYKQSVVDGELIYDDKQMKVLSVLDSLKSQLELECSPSLSSPVRSSRNCPRGAYIYGTVGTGKTMLMDKFFEDVRLSAKRRIHFSEFMLEVHSRIHKHKQSCTNGASERETLAIIAQGLASEAQLLCFDEFQVTDICDAMVLSFLFRELFRRGTVLVATSNRPPTDLYLGGQHREYFLPFIEQIQRECLVCNIGIDKDYRVEGALITGSAKGLSINSNNDSDGSQHQHQYQHLTAFFTPCGEESSRQLRRMFEADLKAAASVGSNGSSSTIPSTDPVSTIFVSIPVMMGRTLVLDMASRAAGACFVEFSDLCRADLGASDYQALCAHFHTIYMVNIPILTVLSHNEARRLITLIDAIYNASVRFIWTADAPPAQLFRILSAQELQAARDGLSTGSDVFGTDRSWAELDTVNDSGGGHVKDSHSQLLFERNLRGSEQRVFSGRDLGLSVDTGASNDTDAAAELKLLEGELSSVQELRFAFKRAASRLTEMSGAGYVRKWQLKHH